MRKSVTERYTLIWKKYLHENVVAEFHPATVKCDLLFFMSFHENERLKFIIKICGYIYIYNYIYI